jgi:hypothetical protein
MSMYKHGGYGTREYNAWIAAKRRTVCLRRAHIYSKRGIDMCARWTKDFTAFLEDMGQCPEGHSLDRIDNSRGYSKDNCRWATPREQANNRRSNRLITFNGQTQTMAEWCRQYGIYKDLFKSRLKRGWTVAQALRTPRQVQDHSSRHHVAKA